MASSDFLDDIPSSPLSSVPSDFDRSSEQREVHGSSPLTKSSTTPKRKAPTTHSAPARASRRLKTEDSFERSLTAIKENIILPKVAKSRQSAREQNAATKTENERAPASVCAQNDGLDERQSEVTEGQVPPAAALEVRAVDGDDAIGNPLPTSVQDAPEELLQARQPLSQSVDEAPKRLVDAQQPLPTPSICESPEQPAHTQNAPSPSLDEAQEQPLHAQQPEAAPEEDLTIDVNGGNNLRPVPITKTSNTPSNPTSSIPRTMAHENTDETTEAQIARKLSPPELPDETLDELTQDEPRTNTRPSRKRLQPTKLEGYEPPIKAVSASVKKKAQPLRGNWSVSHLLTNPESKLATCNLNVSRTHLEFYTIADTLLRHSSTTKTHGHCLVVSNNSSS